MAALLIERGAELTPLAAPPREDWKETRPLRKRRSQLQRVERA
jgi:hypothetical protein